MTRGGGNHGSNRHARETKQHEEYMPGRIRSHEARHPAKIVDWADNRIDRDCHDRDATEIDEQGQEDAQYQPPNLRIGTGGPDELFECNVIHVHPTVDASDVN